MNDEEKKIVALSLEVDYKRRALDKASIELQQGCIEMHQKGYSGYRLAQLTGFTKMTIYKWVKPKNH
jgi:hypothetical protein